MYNYSSNIVRNVENTQKHKRLVSNTHAYTYTQMVFNCFDKFFSLVSPQSFDRCGLWLPGTQDGILHVATKGDLDLAHPSETMGSPLHLTFPICKMGCSLYLRAN
jgi:hypothetical protein